MEKMEMMPRIIKPIARIVRGSGLLSLNFDRRRRFRLAMLAL